MNTALGKKHLRSLRKNHPISLIKSKIFYVEHFQYFRHLNCFLLFYSGCEARGMLDCDGGSCISSNSICDGVRDCHDNSDEENCPERGALRKQCRADM